MIKELRSRQDGSICTEATFRVTFPTTIFPRIISVETLASKGYDIVFPTPKPTPSTNLKRIVRDGTVEDANDNWVQAWTEVDMFSDTTDEEGVVTTKAKHEEDYLAKLLQEAKDAKITTIDTQTGIDIELVVGDSVAQRNMLAEYLYMLDAGQDITAYKTKWEQVALLRTDGNAKEAQVQSCTTIDEVEAI